MIISKWKILALIFFVANIALLAWLTIVPRSSKINFDNPYPLIDPARSFTAQENFIVNLQPLRQELRELVQKEGPTSITLYFEVLNTGANISINTDLKIWPASLVKLPLAMAVMKKIESGGWGLDTQLALTEEDRDPEVGFLFAHPTGTRFSIERLLDEVLSHSDNTAYHILLRNMGTSELQPIINETGLDELFNDEGFFSAKEYARLYRSLYTSSFLQRANSSKILEWLSQTDFDRYLAAGIDENVRFANKWGMNPQFHAFLDSGIAYVPDQPYILVVMVQGDQSENEEEKVEAIMKEISSKAYQYITTYGK